MEASEHLIFRSSLKTSSMNTLSWEAILRLRSMITHSCLKLDLSSTSLLLFPDFEEVPLHAISFSFHF